MHDAADNRVVEIERAVGDPKQENAEGEAEIADPIDEKRLQAGRRGRGLLEPEADQQIAAQADGLPEDVEEDEVARRHQHRHREDEQRNVGEEPPIAGIAVHVADGIDRHEQRNERDHRQHDGGNGSARRTTSMRKSGDCPLSLRERIRVRGPLLEMSATPLALSSSAAPRRRPPPVLERGTRWRHRRRPTSRASRSSRSRSFVSLAGASAFCRTPLCTAKTNSTLAAQERANRGDRRPMALPAEHALAQRGGQQRGGQRQRGNQNQQGLDFHVTFRVGDRVARGGLPAARPPGPSAATPAAIPSPAPLGSSKRG